MNSLFVGNFKAAFQGRWVEFQDFRQYSPNDDARYIDWCISSREGTTIMRRYQEEKEGNIFCLVENTSEMLFDFEMKHALCHKIISLIWYSALKSGESFGGYVLSKSGVKYIPAKKNESSIIALENKLDEAVYEGDIDYAFLMKKSLRRQLIFIITPSLQENLDRYTHITQKHDVILIHIASHFENTLDGKGLNYIQWDSRAIAIDLDNREKKETYKKLRTTQRENMMREAYKKWMSCMSIDETSSLYGEFLHLMKQREWNR